MEPKKKTKQQGCCKWRLKQDVSGCLREKDASEKSQKENLCDSVADVPSLSNERKTNNSVLLTAEPPPAVFNKDSRAHLKLNLCRLYCTNQIIYQVANHCHAELEELFLSDSLTERVQIPDLTNTPCGLPPSSRLTGCSWNSAAVSVVCFYYSTTWFDCCLIWCPASGTSWVPTPALY